MTRVLLVCMLLVAAIMPKQAVAHEVRPAYLEITQLDASRYQLIWKQPTQGEVAVHLAPHLSNGWLDAPPIDQYAASGFLIRAWQVTAQQGESLQGVAVEIEGLQDTITDAFINVRMLDGERIQGMARPQQPRFVLQLKASRALAVPAYLWLGIEHILTGPDHLLFVLGLLLIVRGRRRLLITVSAFTLAHSLTLAASTLGKIDFPVSFVETLIALSILFLGLEAVRVQRGGDSITLRWPWLAAFVFGLFHGMGFASGLTALGFRRDELFATLALFNVGVELGQLGFISLVFTLAAALRAMRLPQLQHARLACAYLIGSGGAYWAVQRGTQWLGVVS